MLKNLLISCGFRYDALNLNYNESRSMQVESVETNTDQNKNQTPKSSPDERKSDRRDLSPVIKIIPKTCYEKSYLQGVGLFVRDVVIYIALLAVAASTDTWYILIPVYVLLMMNLVGLFIIGHDAAHGSLTASNKLNDLIANLAMLPGLHMSEIWKYGHNRIHHGRTVNQVFDFIWHPYTAEQYNQMNSFQKLRHKFEWGPLGSGMYYLREIWWNRTILFKPPKSIETKVRLSKLMLTAVFIIGSYFSAKHGLETYGTMAGALWMWIKLVALPFYLVNHAIAWAVYVHHISPEITWHRRKEWDPFKGQVQGTTIFRVSKIANFFLHNIFEHVPHHVDARIPCYHLIEASDAIVKHFPEDAQVEKLNWNKFKRFNEACKLYDFDNHCWQSYPI